MKRFGPVLAIKIDNVAQARPQSGLTDADIVYVLRASRPAAGWPRPAAPAPPKWLSERPLAPAVVS